jgi:AraC-like DNA-binding protein
MKIAKLRLHQETDKSFIFHHEKYPFAPWHHHPEYEMVLSYKGKGRRMVGDSVDRYEENEVVFTGPFLPHQWICDADNIPDVEKNSEEAYVIQFVYDFLGENFFELPENASLKKFLLESVRGYKIYGKSRDRIISIMLDMIEMDDVARLYALFSIFEIFANTKEFCFLSSKDSVASFMLKENEAMQRALQYIMQNFQRAIQVKDLLEVTNMSYASFYSSFKRTYKVPFKDYLLDIRIDYACKLLSNEDLNISEIAYSCGFENLSNFNRQFRRFKSMNPSQYQRQLQERVMPG